MPWQQHTKRWRKKPKSRPRGLPLDRVTGFVAMFAHERSRRASADLFGGSEPPPGKHNAIGQNPNAHSRPAAPTHPLPLGAINFERMNSRSVDTHECPVGRQLATTKQAREKR